MEFLVQGAEFYFMEMNTRLQVEHTVTEEATGVDLVGEQIRVAAGEPLSLTQESIHLRGHCLECRINAEDPDLDFRPTPGRIEFLHFPGGPGVRVDSHLYQGYVVPPQYDSMIGKVIVRGETRTQVLARMRRALQELVVEGVPTTAPFHLRVLETPEFREGRADTGFLERYLSSQADSQARR